MQQGNGERPHLGILLRHALLIIARKPIHILTPMFALGLIVSASEKLVAPFRDLPQRILRGLPLLPGLTDPAVWIALGVLWTVSVYGLGVTTLAAHGALRPHDYTLRELLLRAVMRLPRAFIVSLFVTGAVRLGFEAFVIPGYVLLVILSLAVPIAFLERTTSVRSMRRSINIVRAYWMSAAIIVLGFNIFVSTLQYLGQFVAPTAESITLVGSVIAAPIIALNNTLLVVLYAAATSAPLSEA